MLALMLGFGFIGVLALVLLLTFAASGITWLIATAVPGSSEPGRRQVGLVAIVSGAILAAVLVLGAVLLPARAERPQPGPFPGPNVPGQPQPAPPTR